MVILLRPAGQERSDDHVCPNVPSVLALQIPRPESAVSLLTIPGSNSATGVSQSRASRIRCLTCGPKTPLWRQIARRVLVCRSCHFLTLSGYSALAKPMAKSGRLSKIPSVVRGPSVLPNLLMIFPMRSRSNSCVNIVQVDPTSCTVSLQPGWERGWGKSKDQGPKLTFSNISKNIINLPSTLTSSSSPEACTSSYPYPTAPHIETRVNNCRTHNRNCTAA